MIRTNSFSIKILISLTLFSFSLFFFYISYQEFSKYYQEDTVLFEDMNINYFDKELFKKYYEKIDIENLSDPQFNEEKSKNYFKDIAFDNLFDLFDQEKENKVSIYNYKIGPPVQLKTEEELIAKIKKPPASAIFFRKLVSVIGSAKSFKNITAVARQNNPSATDDNLT